jgi:hypothetical protein
MTEALKMEAVLGFLHGFGLAVLLAIGLVGNMCMNSKEEISACETACGTNEGMRALFLDSDCECRNGAEFSWKKIAPTPEEKPHGK